MEKEQAVRQLRELYVSRRRGEKRWRITVEQLATALGLTPPTVHSYFLWIREKDAGVLVEARRGRLPGSDSTTAAITRLVTRRARKVVGV